MSHIKLILSTGGALALLASTAMAKIDREVDRSFQVQPGVHLKITTSGGDIEIHTSSDPVVKVVAKEHIHAANDVEADDLLKRLDLRIEQNGNDVVASASTESGLGLHLFGGNPVQVDFIISAPASASADLKTSGGDISVENLDGELKAHTSGGNIKAGEIGGDVDASTSGGNVVLGEGRGSIRLTTSGGNISARHVVGAADLKTSGGDIKVDSVENTLEAETSGGDIRANFEGAIKGDSSLSTSGGEVKASVGKGVGFHLDASTSGGEVDASGLTITIDRGGSGKSTLSGQVNGGGPTLRLRSSGGDVEIVTR